MKITKFNTSTYNFTELISNLFQSPNLDYLHELSRNEYSTLFEVGADSNTVFHEMFYEKKRSGWYKFDQVYYSFIKDIVAPRYNEDILFQRFPTFRCHLPGNVAVGAFHNDAEFNHPENEVNYILPINNADSSASVWVESVPGEKDFRPIVMRAGELIEFDGNKLTHGNKVNITGKTRVSIDFRVLPLSAYKEGDPKESVTRKTKFKIGEYYSLFKK